MEMDLSSEECHALLQYHTSAVCRLTHMISTASNPRDVDSWVSRLAQHTDRIKQLSDNIENKCMFPFRGNVHDYDDMLAHNIDDVCDNEQ